MHFNILQDDFLILIKPVFALTRNLVPTIKNSCLILEIYFLVLYMY